MLQYAAYCCSVLHLLRCVAVYYIVLQFVVLCCGVLQCVTVCFSVLQCVAVFCSMLQCVAVHCSALQCVAVCCSVLQCVAVRCSASEAGMCATQQARGFVGQVCESKTKRGGGGGQGDEIEDSKYKSWTRGHILGTGGFGIVFRAQLWSSLEFVAVKEVFSSGGREGGREAGREGGREAGRKGGREREMHTHSESVCEYVRVCE